VRNGQWIAVIEMGRVVDAKACVQIPCRVPPMSDNP
jgi:hypothetical protein